MDRIRGMDRHCPRSSQSRRTELPQPPMNLRKSAYPQCGFTLLELLVVLAVIATLAAVLAPALARGKSRARAGSCANNLRQLGAAFHLYLDDNSDVFPTSSPHSGLGAQPEDWVWWQVETVASGGFTMRDPNRGSVVQHLGPYQPRLLRCPSPTVSVSISTPLETLTVFTPPFGPFRPGVGTWVK